MIDETENAPTSRELRVGQIVLGVAALASVAGEIAYARHEAAARGRHRLPV